MPSAFQMEGSGQFKKNSQDKTQDTLEKILEKIVKRVFMALCCLTRGGELEHGFYPVHGAGAV